MKELNPKRQPLFTKIAINKKTAKNIHYIQQRFEYFCDAVMRQCPDNREREQAIIRLQESCIWFCRSTAVRDWKEPITTEPEPIQVEPSEEEIAEIKEDEEAIKKANGIQPTIVIKKKKISLNKS